MAGETYSFKGETCQWGTTSTSSAGTVVDEDLKETAQTDVVENNKGARTGMVIYDTIYAGSLTIVAAASATPPSIGDVITVLDVSLVVTDVDNKGTHKGKRMFTVSCDGGANLSLSTGSGGSSGGGTQ